MGGQIDQYGHPTKSAPQGGASNNMAPPAQAKPAIAPAPNNALAQGLMNYDPAKLRSQTEDTYRNLMNNQRIPEYQHQMQQFQQQYAQRQPQQSYYQQQPMNYGYQNQMANRYGYGQQLQQPMNQGQMGYGYQQQPQMNQGGYAGQQMQQQPYNPRNRYQDQGFNGRAY